MPIHDWTRVPDGTWHDFHLAWLAELRKVLNGGVLPPGYYAQAEQIAGPLGPDVLTLQESTAIPAAPGPESGALTLAARPSRPRLVAAAESSGYAASRRTILIRYTSGDRIVALVEVLSPGNKSSRHAVRQFVEKATEALYRGFHLLLVDLFPPGKRDPNGIHPLIWEEFGDDEYTQPADAPLTLAAYSAGPIKRAYLEPTAVGRELIEMPLFLDPETYVNVDTSRRSPPSSRAGEA